MAAELVFAPETEQATLNRFCLHSDLDPLKRYYRRPWWRLSLDDSLTRPSRRSE
jgi:hypothetical protein